MATSLLSIAQIATLLDERSTGIDYVVRKHGIEPASRVGNIRLFSWKQVTAIRMFLDGKRAAAEPTREAVNV